ncbi:PhfB [Pseudomonas chlororaphis]|uniref:fimbrial protein n=1 Tax=Pseudomonas chlororaphis TaxID=587753 RepID=UPI000F579914|nr:fimbrial protein [Pseudomonas chlororaphis]AZD09520.1 PhfB [Pseudomonas chlororaphis]
MNIFKKTLLTVLALGGASVSLSAYANCTFAPGSSADTQEAINFGTVTVPPSAPIGTVVATRTSTLIGSRGVFITGCTTFNQQDWRSPGLPAVSYAGEVLYQSGVPGYAIRIFTPGAGSTARQFGSGPFDRILTNNTCVAGPTSWSYCGGSWGNVTFELVKIAPNAGSGTISPGTLVRASIRGWQFIYTANLTSSAIISPGCTVTNSNVAVSMGDIPRKDFNGVGSFAAIRNFFISLNCDANAQVDVKLDATADSSGVPGVVALSAPTTGSAASGVGVQILYNGSPVTLGTAFRVNNPATAGRRDIPFIARYYQTSPNILAGKANATATFTVTYN